MTATTIGRVLLLDFEFEAGGAGGVLAMGMVGTVVSFIFEGLLRPISARWVALEGVGVELKGSGKGELGDKFKRKRGFWRRRGQD